MITLVIVEPRGSESDGGDKPRPLGKLNRPKQEDDFHLGVTFRFAREVVFTGTAAEGEMIC